MLNKIYLLLTFIIFSTTIEAQTTTVTTFNYQNESLPSTCNTFATAQTVSGPSFVHRTSFGAPKFRNLYGTGPKNILMESYKQSSSTILATQFFIEYPFKAGAKYKIRIYGKFVLTSNVLKSPLIGVRLTSDASEINSSSSCDGPAQKASGIHLDYRNTTLSANWSWTPYVYEETAMNDQNYLQILSTPGGDKNFVTFEEAYIGAIEITEERPATTPPFNDDYTNAINLTPSNSTTCIEQTTANFNNSTVTQWSYEDFGENGGNDHASMSYAKGDVWYKFTAINMTHEITVSGLLPSGYGYKIELYSKNGTVLKVLDTENNDFNNSPSIKTSGLNVGQEYLIRVILITAFQNNNVSLNICVTTPIIQSPIIKTKNRYESNMSGTYVYDGNVIGLSYAIPQNVPESDLSFDWRVVEPNVQALDGVFLYNVVGPPINNGTYSLLNITGRRVKLGLGPKAPGNPLPYYLFYIEVRIKQISTNTYLTDWIRGGGGMTEM